MRLVYVGIATVCAARLAIAVEQRTASEQSIAVLQQEVPATEWQLIVSEDGSHVAWTARQGDGWTVYLDGQPAGGPYKKASALAFDGGNRLAWSAQLVGGWAPFLDGKQQGGPFKEVLTFFSGEGSRFAYAAKDKDGSRFFVENARPQSAYKEAYGFASSRDGRHFAYRAKRGKDTIVVTDGEEGPAYSEVGRVRFRKNSNLPLYVANRGKEWFLVEEGKAASLPASRDGYELIGLTPVRELPILKVFDGDASRFEFGDRRSPAHRAFTSIQFSPDERHFVYATARSKSSSVSADRAVGQVFVDGQAGGAYEAAPLESAGAAWLRAASGGSVSLKAGLRDDFTPRWEGVSRPAVRWDGLKVAYSARFGKGDVAVVVNGSAGPHHTSVPCAPAWSPDGKLFYGAVDSGRLAIVVDGQHAVEATPSSGAWNEEKDACAPFKFAEEGRYAFHVMNESELLVGVAGRIIPLPAASVSVALNTPPEASKQFHYAIMAKWSDPSKGYSVIIDGLAGKSYDDVWPDSFRWLSGDEFRYMARRGDQILRVTERLSSPSL